MTKIPIMDEFVRSLQSFGDYISGDTAAARRRWENWDGDSLLGTAGMAVGSMLASGANSMVGQTDTAAIFYKQAWENGEKFGATAISSVSQAGGTLAQGLSFGVPNPLSGALNGFASGVNRIVDEDAMGGTNGISWYDLGKEGRIGAAKGAVSFGGIIPYAGTAVEKTLRGDEVEFDQREEWANCVINAALTVGTFGTVKGTAALTKAGKIGVKRALAIGGASGLAMGSGAAFISQEVQSAALGRRMNRDGYQYDRDEQGDDGREYAVYTKRGMPDIYAPKPDKGNIVAQGVMHGVTTAVAVKFEVKKQLKQKEMRGDQPVNRNRRDEQPPRITINNVNNGTQITINNVNNGTQVINCHDSQVSSCHSGGRNIGTITSVPEVLSTN